MVATASSPATAARRRFSAAFDLQAIWTWVLTLSVVLYLGIAGGGYDLVVRSRLGVAVWWILLIGALIGVPVLSRVGRAGRVALVLLAAFAIWSTASTLWSLSSERSLDEASRLAAYLGIACLAAITVGERERALRHVIGALSVAIFVIAALALLGRLDPGLFPGSTATGAALPDARARLSWPLNYWNALGAMMAFGTPLLLTVATSARAHRARALAAAAVPAVLLCGYLTFSRAAAVAAAVGLVVFLILSPRRASRLLSVLLCAAGGAVLVAETVRRHAIENGQSTHAAFTQGRSLLILVIVVCVLTGAAQLGLAVAFDRVKRLSSLTVPVRPAVVATGVGIVILIVIAVAVGVPHRLDHAYQVFKNPNGANVHSDTIARFTALSGNGRYTYWKAAIDAMPGHWFDGFGLGTFQFVWLQRALSYNYIVNAHSLYIETLTEVGIIGLVLLVGYLVTVLVAAIRSIRIAPPTRGFAAGAAAACAAFVISAGFDWIWQVPVVPAAFLILAAAVLAPRAAVPAGETRPLRRIAGAAVVAVAAVLCLGLIGTPMAMTQALRRSQAEVNAGDLTAALTDARTAVNAEPGAASPDIQMTLVLELQGRFSEGVTYATRATSNEPQNWNAWLVRSRLEAEGGHPQLAVTAYDRARSLNPQSPLFRG